MMMIRRTALLIAFVMLGSSSCASQPQSAGPQTVLTELVTDETGQVQVDVRYNPNPPDKIELIIDLAAVGIQEMDKIAVDVKVDDFAVLEGSSQWSGFAAPRERHHHRMLLQANEGAESGTITVTMSRFHDSEVLWQDTAAFDFTGTTVVARGST